jgi:hypothetical protein
MAKSGKHAGGRPPRHPGERLSKTRTFRVRGGLDDYLQAEAAATGRSVSEVIEMHLEIARIRRDYLVEQWGGEVFDIAGRLAKALWHIEAFTGEEWTKDDRTYHLFQLALAEIVRNYRDDVIRLAQTEWSGHEGVEGKTDRELAHMFAALSDVKPQGARIARTHEAEKKSEDDGETKS